MASTAFKVARSVGANALAGAAPAPPVRLAVYVSAEVPPEVARAFRKAFAPASGGAFVMVAGFGPETGLPAVNADADAAVVLAGGDADPAARMACGNALARVPVAVVADEGGSPAVSRRLAELGRQGDRMISVLPAGPDDVSRAVGEWLLDAAPAKAAALAAGFRPCAREATRRGIVEAGGKNAAVAFLPSRRGGGSDRGRMCANEAAMASGMAPAPDPVRGALVDAGVVAGTAVVGRGVARALSRRLPLPDRLVKALVAFVSTAAAGVAMARFRQDAGADAAEAPHARAL